MDHLTDRGFATFLGLAVRRARESRGLTRAQLVEKLPSGIGDRTLLSYEHGVRFLSVVRFVEICRAIGVPADEVLGRASAMADDVRNLSLRVNLRALLRDEDDRFEAVRLWADRRLDETATPVLLVEPAALREMAAVIGVSHEVLAGYLAEFITKETL